MNVRARIGFIVRILTRMKRRKRKTLRADFYIVAEATTHKS